MRTLTEELKKAEAYFRETYKSAAPWSNEYHHALLLWRARIRIVALTEMVEEGNQQ